MIYVKEKEFPEGHKALAGLTFPEGHKALTGLTLEAVGEETGLS